MSLIIKCRVKDKGEIVWPPIGEPDAYSTEGSIESEARGRIEWLRENVRQAAADTRSVLDTTPSRAVHVSLTFKPDIMVDPA